MSYADQRIAHLSAHIEGVINGAQPVSGHAFPKQAKAEGELVESFPMVSLEAAAALLEVDKDEIAGAVKAHNDLIKMEEGLEALTAKFAAA